MEALFSKTIDMLSIITDYRAKRHKVIASNVANLDTEGYKPSEINFKTDLKQAFGSRRRLALAKTQDAIDESRKVLVSRTHKRHLPDRHDQNIEYEAKITGDKVKLDVEMANLAENQLMYNTTIEMLARKFRGLQNVLKEAK
ncbi:MAG: Flagellar basal body rod protein FlgB [Syntrophus sp. SKADARSKE-3]|nr:Flagellar basal body rod protein FlgB [Syntrophus sp. SKADARSKE-3]